MQRTAGILLHPTSLPGRGPCGDLGEGADRFLDWLERTGAGLWQVLPLGPVGYGDSPYTPASVFAGNPLLLSAGRLALEGWIAPAEGGEAAAGTPSSPHCDFAAARRLTERVLRTAWEGLPRAPVPHRRAWEEYRDRQRGGWLDDWALYAALKDRHGQREWSAWPRELALREPHAIEAARGELAGEIELHRFAQFLFEVQWRRVRDEAHRRGIRILGDLPIYPALDSADVWSRRELFDLDAEGRPRHVAGVPPDYFSETGQLWGNPLYDWERLAETGFDWWIERLRVQLARVDLLRIDHFRGLEAFWEVPASDATAAGGRWRKAPGESLFRELRAALGELPLIAEDLGVITPEVEALRERLALPGMKVLQFAFDEPASLHLPHCHRPDHVAYTGTHDNDTTLGWFGAAGAETRRRALAYLGGGPEEIHRSLLRAAWTSVASCAIAPLQDALGLGPEARLNHPGHGHGNWTWRVTGDQLDADTAAFLHDLTEVSNRLATEQGARLATEQGAQSATEQGAAPPPPDEAT